MPDSSRSISRFLRGLSSVVTWAGLLSALGAGGCRMSDDGRKSAPSASASASSAAAPAAPHIELPRAAPTGGPLPAGVTLSTEIPAAPAWSRWNNAVFHYGVDYPTFMKLGVFTEDRGGIDLGYFDKINVFVAGRASTDPPDKLLETSLAARGQRPARTTSSRTMRADGYLVSGESRGRVFVERALTDGKTAVTLTVDYDPKLAPRAAPIAKRIADSLAWAP